MTAYNLVVFQWISKKSVTVWKILKRSFKWDQSGISSFIRLKVTSKTSKLFQKWEKFHNQDNCPKSPWNCSCLTGYISVFFGRIYKKLVTVGKILKRSSKWDQSGISSLIHLKVTSKTRLLVQKMGKFNDLYLMKVKNVSISKGAPGIFLHSFAMDYTWAGPLETVIKVPVLLV